MYSQAHWLGILRLIAYVVSGSLPCLAKLAQGLSILAYTIGLAAYVFSSLLLRYSQAHCLSILRLSAYVFSGSLPCILRLTAYVFSGSLPVYSQVHWLGILRLIS